MCPRLMHRRWSRTASSAISSRKQLRPAMQLPRRASRQTDRCHRARRHAGAAARAGTGINLRHGRPAKARAETDGSHRAGIAANPTLHTFFRQAIFGDPRLDRPRPLRARVAAQGAILAGGGAGAAEGAFTAFEIHLGIAPCLDDDSCRANRNALAAARTFGAEDLLGTGPGRALRCAAGLEIPPQELSTTDHGKYVFEPRAGFCLRTASDAREFAALSGPDRPAGHREIFVDAYMRVSVC